MVMLYHIIPVHLGTAFKVTYDKLYLRSPFSTKNSNKIQDLPLYWIVATVINNSQYHMKQ